MGPQVLLVNTSNGSKKRAFRGAGEHALHDMDDAAIAELCLSQRHMVLQLLTLIDEALPARHDA